MKSKITKNHIFTALAILCGIVAVIGLRLNDMTAILSLLFMLLAGGLAYFGLRLRGIYFVSAMGVVQCLFELLGSSGDSPDGDLSGFFITAFIIGCFYAFLGTVGMVGGFLLKSACDRVSSAFFSDK